MKGFPFRPVFCVMGEERKLEDVLMLCYVSYFDLFCLYEF